MSFFVHENTIWLYNLNVDDSIKKIKLTNYYGIINTTFSLKIFKKCSYQQKLFIYWKNKHSKNNFERLLSRLNDATQY